MLNGNKLCDLVGASDVAAVDEDREAAPEEYTLAQVSKLLLLVDNI